MSTNNSSRFTPFIIAISIVLGILVGTFYANHFSGSKLGIINTSSNKLNALLRIIDDQYVDTVNMTDLVENAMPQILSELDPHSMYIPAKDLEATNSELEGSFSGIGIQFSIQNDTIHVNSVIQGGPSEKVGLMAGDRIVSVDDSAFVGKDVTIDTAPRKLKGPKGSKVKLGIARPGEKNILYFTVVRGDIPVNSVDAAYMLDEKYGYIKVNKFGRTTHAELLMAIAKLAQKECQGLVIDLRGNTGGYMEAAIQMVTEFLPKDKLIVYTQGRKYPREERFSNGTGSCQNTPLVVLIDEGSASASEIFAGAIQDNDRGTIIGRRSFGKGLVQQPIDFSDGSAIRLTIARYYTPSGRSIQKHYTKGNDSDYEMDILKRYEHGEFFSEDSIKQNTDLKYTTGLGRTVYGGGGIMPDIFVPQDTTGVTTYYSMVVNRALPIQFSFQYTDKNRIKLQKYPDEQSLLKYLKEQGIIEQFVNFAESKGVKRRNIQIQKSHKLLEKILYGNIIYNMLGIEEYIKFLNISDVTVNKALDILRKGESYPKAPQPVKEKTKNARTKKQLRVQIARRKALYTHTELTKLSDALLNKLEQYPAFQQAKTVLLYYSLKDEVQTHDFVERWSKTKNIVLPVVVGDYLELRNYTGKQDLQTGSYNIEEPIGEIFNDYKSIDLAIIPGVSFDKEGNRLGRGKGYYDQLLPLLTSSFKIGICFSFQFEDKIPCEEHDIKMDCVFTDKEVFNGK